MDQAQGARQICGLLQQGYRYAFALTHDPGRAEDLVVMVGCEFDEWRPGFFPRRCFARFIAASFICIAANAAFVLSTLVIEPVSGLDESDESWRRDVRRTN